jgi:hypothetical protein
VTTFHSQFTCQTKRTNDSSDWQHPSVVSPTMSSKTIGHQSIYGIADASHQAWKYFDEHEPFEELDLYLPPRFRRCILQKVGETLRSHTDRRDAFQSIQSIKSDASTVVAPKNNSGMTVTTSRQATWTSSSTNSPATTTVTGRIQPRISKCKAVQSTIAASRCSLRTTAQPAVKPSNTSTTPMVRC